MTISNQATLTENQAAASKDDATSVDELEAKFSLPETTMFVIGTSGLLWALLYGAFTALFR